MQNLGRMWLNFTGHKRFVVTNPDKWVFSGYSGFPHTKWPHSRAKSCQREWLSISFITFFTIVVKYIMVKLKDIAEFGPIKRLWYQVLNSVLVECYDVCYVWNKHRTCILLSCSLLHVLPPTTRLRGSDVKYVFSFCQARKLCLLYPSYQFL